MVSFFCITFLFMPYLKVVRGFEFLDSRGNPTVSVEVELEGGDVGLAIVPSGASKGKKEALELRDGDKRYFGKGVRKALANLEKLFQALKNVHDQKSLDLKMIELDGTWNKSNIGANAILGLSLAYAKACAKHMKVELFEYLGNIFGNKKFSIPVPLCNVINGGEHAGWNVDIQEYMIVPVGFDSFEDAIRCSSEIFHTIKKILSEKSISVGVGDEGGFAIPARNNEEPLQILTQAVEKSGYKLKEHVFFALDVASSSFYDEKEKLYVLKREGKKLDSYHMIEYISNLCEKYPMISIEDPMAESDLEGWKNITQLLGKRIQLVGDDVFVTNPKIFQTGIDNGIANSILVKVNQIGTLTETFEVLNMAKKAGYSCVVSHRSGDTEDTFIADLSVGTDSKQIKTGSLSRSERIAKYNRLIYIEKKYGVKFSGKEAFLKFL